METKEIQTNIHWDRQLWEQAKIHCIKNQISMKTFIHEAVKEKLEKTNHDNLPLI